MTRHRSRKVKAYGVTCDYCAHFHAENVSCAVCGKKPTATATKPSASAKRGETAIARSKASSSWLTTLHAAGMQTDNQIAEGLATGAVVQAIGWQANYSHVIDYLENRGYEVAGYRARVVAGSNKL